MARLRKPSTAEAPILIAPAATAKSTRSSPRKILRESPSKRELRCTSSQDSDDSFVVQGDPAGGPPVRKQRVLGSVASNSRLLDKLSNERLTTPHRKGRRREGGAEGESVRKQRTFKLKRGDVGSRVEREGQREAEPVVDEDVEKSIWCGDEEDEKEKETENAQIVDESEDEEPVVVRQRRQVQPRRMVSNTEEDDQEGENEAMHSYVATQHEGPKPVGETVPPPLTSLRPPFRKGHGTVSNWALEVIDLTNSPEPPTAVDSPPPARVRSTSFEATSRPTSSASDDMGAILRFSPTPTKLRSPRKAPPISRPSTPPAPISPSKLVSPSKKHPRIPKAPDLRPSIDAFWNPEVVNEWNDKHSPSKPLLSPRKQKLFQTLKEQMNAITIENDDSEASFPSPTTSPRKKKLANPTTKLSSSSSSPSVTQIRAQRKDFASRKHALAESFLADLDNTLTDGRIAALSYLTGGIKLIWSKTLKTTAGRANWRREQIRLRTGPLPSDSRVEIRHHCSIELAEKVIDNEERLCNVLAHEYCHLTTFMISEVRNNPHGAEFKAWGAKATRSFASKGVEVTTKHSYKIEYKYVWECIGCGYEFKRHSKSVDPVRHSCGRCKGRLVQTKPVPRGGKTVEGKKEKSEYQVFVKANFGRVKREMAEKGLETQMGKVMEMVAREYREVKARKGKGIETAVDEVELALEGLKL